MNYRDFFKNKKTTEKDIQNLLPEGVSKQEFSKGIKIESASIGGNRFLAATLASKNLGLDKNYYSKIYENYDEEQEECDGMEEHCGACDSDVDGIEGEREDLESSEIGGNDENEYDDNGGLPLVGGALAVPHVGKPISLGKVVTIGGGFDSGESASGELSGYTNAVIPNGQKDKGGIPANQPNDKEHLTAGGHKTDPSIASKSVGGPVVPGEGQTEGGLNTKGTIANTHKLNERKVRNVVKEVLKEIRFDKKTGKWVKLFNEATVSSQPNYELSNWGAQYTVRDGSAQTEEPGRVNHARQVQKSPRVNDEGTEPHITEMYDDEEECMMNERYVALANAQRNLSEAELTELKTLREKIDRIAEGKKKWIQKATKNMRTDKPCTGDKFGGPTCPPGSKRYNLAKTFKKMAKNETYEEEEESNVDENKWIQKAIKHPGRCTPLSKPGCTGHARALALRFKKGGDLHKEEENVEENQHVAECKKCGCPMEEGHHYQDSPYCAECQQQVEGLSETMLDMNMGASYKVVQPHLYKTAEPDFFGRLNQFDPMVSEEAEEEQQDENVKGGFSNDARSARISQDNPQRHKIGFEKDDAVVNDVAESTKSKKSKVVKTVEKGSKSKKKNPFTLKNPKKTSSGVHKTKPYHS